MITVTATVSASKLDSFLANLPREMERATADSARLLKPLAEENIEELGAVDTYALKNSLYVSLVGSALRGGGSGYLDAVSAAVQAYATNPTKWPEIRQANGGVLDVDPEATPRNRYQAYMGVAASHGKAVEEGYVSYYGNDVPARPFIATTATEGFPQVVDTFRDALERALR